MKASVLRLALVILGITTLAAVAAAQNISGPPTVQWGTYLRSLSDTIDVGHIQVGFTVPVINKPERGIPFNVSLGFGSIAWTDENNAWTPVGVPDDMPPDAGEVGQFSSQIDLYECNDEYGYNYFFNVATNFDYIDPSGVQEFGYGAPISVEDEFPPQCDPAEDPGYPVGQTTVNGQWTMVANSDGTASVITPQGVTMSGWDTANPANDAVNFVDRNGNEMNESYSQPQTLSFDDPAGGVGLSIIGSAAYGGLGYNYAGTGYSGVEITYAAYTLATNFACPGITEYSRAVHLPTKVTLLDGSYYLITYEQTPDYGATYTTGRITSLQIPAGATIHYTYPASQPNDDVNCGSGGSSNPHDGAGRTLELDRQTPDGITYYTASTEAAPPADYTTLQLTTITAPSGDQTVETFAPDSSYFMVKKQVYTGSSASGSLLYTEDRCNQMSIANCDYWVLPYGINLEDRITLPNGMMKDTMSYYCPPWGCLSSPYEVDESGWYTSGDPAWVRKQITNYTVVGPYSLMTPASSEVEDGSGNVVAETDYAYDQFGLQASGASMHQTGTNYGNLTTITTHTSGSATLTKTIQYWDTGEPYLVTVNGLQTYHDYQCNGALPYHVWRAGEPYDQTWGYDCGLEKPTSLTDANGAQTSWQYGTTVGYGLPTKITHPDGSVTNITYTVGGPGTAASTESVTNFSSASDDEYTLFDALGRTVLQQKWNGSNWDSVATAYNADGLAASVSAPYAAANKGEVGGSALTTTSYDGAGRPTEVMSPTGSWVVYSYADNDTLEQLGPAPSGEHIKMRQLEYDALGRLTSVCEITGGTTSAPGGACGQTQAQTGYLTQYSYNLLDKITGVTQNAQAAAGSHETRSFAFDELGRLTQETTPEAGTTSFWFDTPDGSQCTASSPGDLVERKDNAGNYTCYGYDGRHRLTQVTYPSGPNAGATASRHFVYDATADGSTGLSKTLGRLAEAYTQTSNGVQVDEAFSYNISGQVADYYQSSPNSGGYYHASETYYANGTPDVLSLPGAPAATYGLDGGGRINAVTANSAAVVQASGTAYSPLGLTKVEFGSGDSDSYGYNAAGQVTGYTFNMGSYADSGTLTWNFDGSLGLLAVSDTIPGTSDNNTLCSFSEDDLGRLASADCGAAESQTFSYDAFGNMTTDANAGYSFTANFDLNNRIENGGEFLAAYDNDGDLTQDPGTGTASSYDAEGHPVSFEGSTVIYDALGRAVEAGGHELVYGASGALTAEMTGQAAVNEYVPLPGGGAAVYQGTTLAYYRHVDWQGSARLATTPSRTLYSATQYAAFGQPFDSTAGPDLSFTGQPQFYGGDQYNFPMRNLSPIQGRWWTPDPAGLAAVDPSNPQSWNAYAYVNGDPLEETDPLGLCTESSNLGANGQWYVNACTQDIALENAQVQQDLMELILATNQGRWVLFGHPPIRVGVNRPGRQLEPFTPNNRNSCIASALGKGALSVGVDAIGLIPEAGGVARIIGHQAGYVGVVADHVGANIVNAVGHTGAAAQGFEGLTDTSTTGVFSTGLTLAGFIPGLEQLAAGASIVNDAIKTGIAISKCP